MRATLNLHLRDDQLERLRHVAQHMGQKPSEAAVQLIEEALRLREFTFIEFRDSPAGRQAYVKGTRIEAWWIAYLHRELGDKPEQIATRLQILPAAVQSALAYSKAYPEEMDVAIAENDRPIEDLKRLIPELEIYTVDASGPR